MHTFQRVNLIYYNRPALQVSLQSVRTGLNPLYTYMFSNYAITSHVMTNSCGSEASTLMFSGFLSGAKHETTTTKYNLLINWSDLSLQNSQANVIILGLTLPLTMWISL